MTSVLGREKIQKGSKFAECGDGDMTTYTHSWHYSPSVTWTWFVFGQKLTRKHQCVSWCVIIIQNPCLVFPQFRAFPTNCFTQSQHNFNVKFLIDCTTMWQEFMMQPIIAIEENTEQNLHIWPNLTCFFRSSLSWTLPSRRLGFGFNVIVIHPWFATSVTFLRKSGSTLKVVNIS